MLNPNKIKGEWRYFKLMNVYIKGHFSQLVEDKISNSENRDVCDTRQILYDYR